MTRGPDTLFSLDQEQPVRLETVGIDIGSATSQLTFSRLEAERMDSRWVVTRRVTVYESEIMLTPYTDPTTIDTTRLGDFIDDAYARAGLTNDDIDSGAIILTGLALAKRNSRAIAELFSAHAGKFVAVSAGDAIEATLACRGAGIEQLSARSGESIVNVDMGGGTVKYSFVENGRLARVAAIDIGARLVTVDGQQKVLRVEEPAAMLLADLGLALSPGETLTEGVLSMLAERMAAEVLAHGGLLGGAGGDHRLLRTPPLFPDGHKPVINAVTFSGGISEYIYGREVKTFGDLGPRLARAIAGKLPSEGLILREPPGGIRATVLGASQFSLQLSGSTVYASRESLLPLRNVPVVRPAIDLEADELDYAEMAGALRTALPVIEPAGRAVALAFAWQGSATFARIDALCRALLATAGPQILHGHGVPLIIVCDRDIAGLLGRHIQDLTEAVDVLAIDGIEVSEFDFLDIGTFVPGTGALPVVVKSLLFPPLRSADSQLAGDRG